MADPRLRTLKIKTGVVRRLAKETTVYEREADQQKARVEKLKQADKDNYDIKKQEEVLQESLMMIPDVRRRLRTAFDDLKGILASEQADLSECDEYKAAVKLVEDVTGQLADTDESAIGKQ